MGVIKQAGLKQSAITYIGVLIGVVNTLYIYPNFLEPDELGMFRFLIDTATLALPFISLGIHNLSIRMFPVFQNRENGHNGLLFFLTSGVLLGFILFLILFTFFKPFITTYFSGKSSLLNAYWPFIIPMAGLAVFAEICNQYVLNFKKVALPAIFNDLYFKIGLPLIAIIYFFGYISLLQGVYILLGIYVLRVFSYLTYIYVIRQWHWRPNWSFLTRSRMQEMGVYAFYGILGSIGGIFATRIDIFMVAILATEDLKAVGIYSIAVFIANIITVPARSINSIASPVISESWAKNDTTEIDSIYKKSSIILLTLGLFFLIGVWCSVDDLFALMPKGQIFAEGKYVILILGLAKLFDLATSVNGQIIAYSKYFRFNFYAVLILAVLNVISNYIFIPIYQINGAALATMCSLFIFNIVKCLYIQRKMKMQPFTWSTLKVLAIAAVVLIIGLIIPSTGKALLDIFIRSAIISVLFIGAVLFFKISPDIEVLFWQILNKFNIRRK